MTDTVSDLRTRLSADVAAAGGYVTDPPELAGAIGRTMFDLPGSEDLTVTVLLPHGHLQKAPSQSLVRVKSVEDAKTYLGVVTAGPFAEPDSLKGDSPVMVAVATNGAAYRPPFHGRVLVSILGEELPDGTLEPPRLRPLPNSPVFPLNDEESARVLKAGGDIRVGLAVGHRNVVVGIPSDQKAVLPRHTAVLGTTGGGKSTTVAGLVKQAQAAGMAVILLDVEGEYTHLHEPTDDKRMLARLAERGLAPGGVPADRMTLYHLVGRDTANPSHPKRREFSLQFARLSPYTVMEILELSEAQQERFLKAYDIATELMRKLEIFPAKGDAEQERIAMELDELERGYPRLTLSFLIDVVAACLNHAEKPPKETKGKSGEAEVAREYRLFNRHLNNSRGREELTRLLHAVNPPGNQISWKALLGPEDWRT